MINHIAYTEQLGSDKTGNHPALGSIILFLKIHGTKYTDFLRVVIGNLFDKLVIWNQTRQVDGHNSSKYLMHEINAIKYIKKISRYMPLYL